MSKNNTLLVLAMVLATFAFIAFLQRGITGLAVNKNFGSVFIKTTLSATGPLIVLAIILTVAVMALHKTTKKQHL